MKEIPSGPTEVLYFRWVMARQISCAVTGLVWWHISLVWVSRWTGRAVHCAELTGGKIVSHRILHLSSKFDCPSSRGMDLLWVLCWLIVFQMVLIVASWSR